MTGIDWPALEAANAPLNAFVDFDRAAAFGEGPLSGLTIGVKSNIAVRGLPWTAGMGVRRGIVAERDAAVVAKLRAAGAAILGTLNMHEAAFGATTDNPWFGATHNPHRRGYTPGGSSGGSGAAVAAGLCDAALGTDTLGSIRIPAAYNGIYGLKPGWGAVDSEGLVPLARRYDVIGPLARSVDVLERIWRVIGSGDEEGPAFSRLLLLHPHHGTDVEPGVSTGFEQALAALPLPSERLDVGSLTSIRMAALAEVGRELAADLGEDRTAPAELISAELGFITAATEQLPLDRPLLDRLRETLRAALGEDGVLLMPATPHAAFAHGTRAPVSQADFTALANIAGLPALAIPAGLDESRLPVGVQLVGPGGSEMCLIALARRIKPALGGCPPPPQP
jgi:aspartyl-tRNA(Asn)/glutamyl-tRNA(Gln) amidotransferase subunit A